MQRVLILQLLSADGPAYLARWLHAQGVPFEVRNSEAGDAFPDRLDGYRALAILGGEMSANDPLPSLRQAEALFLQAAARGVPTLGHCLGAQLMARALGARVQDSPLPEVGWQAVRVAEHPDAAAWFGPAPSHEVFQWHFEAFSLPPGATLLASNAACPVQAFALGPHLALQFHVELDGAKLSLWAAESTERDQRMRQLHPETVHSPDALVLGAANRLAAQQALAERIYGRWLSSC